MSAQAPGRFRRPGRMYRWMMAFIGLFERWLHLSCRAFSQLASAAIERRLTRGERMRQAVHRTMCGLCRTHERHVHQLHAVAHELAHDADPVADLLPSGSFAAREGTVDPRLSTLDARPAAASVAATGRATARFSEDRIVRIRQAVREAATRSDGKT
ncbi:MAG: hypothetical protein HY905_24095 [Deltaproteobacteria bacterium]|nr:hypothetical protein [Deltaproteobacteria bacterium]